jgi:pilus assembly protein CpaE
VQPEDLTITVLYGGDTQGSEILELVESFSQLRVLGSSSDPREFSRRPQSLAPDLLLVDLDGTLAFPDWLEDLAQGLPQSLILMCSHNRDPDFLIRAMQMGVREFLPLPLQRQDLEAALARAVSAKKRRLQAEDSRAGSVVVLTGHKGGVGVTTVAVNLALALGDLTNARVALVDLGRPFPDVANFLDQEGPHTILDLAQNLASLDHDFIQRIMQPYGDRLAVLYGCPDFKELDSIDPEALEKMFGMLRPLYRWIVVDLSHWLDAFFFQTIKEADLVLLLTDLTVPDLRNLKKLWPTLQDWQHLHEKRVKVVVNRFNKANGLDPRDLEQLIRQPVFLTLPSDYPLLVETLNRGTPLVKAAPRSPLCRSLQQLARRVAEEAGGGSQAEAAAEPAKRKFWIFSRG